MTAINTRTPTGYDRLRPLMNRMTGDEKHLVAATSTLDVLWVLHDQVLNIHPDRTDDPERDRFLLSKGHGPMAYYAVLAEKGFLNPEELASWTEFDSRLGGHPDGVLAPGVEIGSGSLGHGLPLGVGTVRGLRANGRNTQRIVVLLGDAELDEGSNHEAIAVAGRWGLQQLTAVVVDNRSATHGWPDGIAERFAREGWTARTVDGRDHDALHDALTGRHPDRPLAVVAVINPDDEEES